MKTLHLFITLFFLLPFIVSCNKDDDYISPGEVHENIIQSNRDKSDYEIRLIFKDDYLKRLIRIDNNIEIWTNELFKDSNIVVLNVADFIESRYGREKFFEKDFSYIKIEQLKPIGIDSILTFKYLKVEVENTKWLDRQDRKFVVREY